MSKMTHCKACGREIAKGAKVCPGCGKRQRMSSGKRLLFVIVVFSVIGAIGGTLGGGKGSSSGDEPAKTYKVGESFTVDKLEITVTKVEKRSSIVDALDASEGATFVAVAYKYKNISDSAISGFSSGVDIKLVSPDGNEYAPDLAASTGYAMEIGGNEKVVSDLNPGITVKGGDVFEVAKDKLKANGWKLNVEGNAVTVGF